LFEVEFVRRQRSVAMADTMKKDQPTSTEGRPGEQRPEGTTGQTQPGRGGEDINRGEEERNRPGQGAPGQGGQERQRPGETGERGGVGKQGEGLGE
jgi:hypothetical protein